jgi:hypothetical protein
MMYSARYCRTIRAQLEWIEKGEGLKRAGPLTDHLSDLLGDCVFHMDRPKHLGYVNR